MPDALSMGEVLLIVVGVWYGLGLLAGLLALGLGAIEGLRKRL